MLQAHFVVQMWQVSFLNPALLNRSNERRERDNENRAKDSKPHRLHQLFLHAF